MDVKNSVSAQITSQNADDQTPQNSPIPTNAEEFQKYIEVEVLKIIKELAEKGQTSKERIQEIARLTLTLIHPGMSLQELYQNAVKLDDQHSELCPVVFRIMKEYEEKYSQKAIAGVSNLIKAGKYTEANDLVKKILQFKFVN
ncbi:hypothetical protein COY87_00570 [Candidatus Roizmanbacteria bacterium CG_4_10_14_0_8_um_filter_33_9]|uniref:Uncharacterized protein n=1 Tax=Candidatus Roizmanbacteria bacterium CG_4_10_14_0_8_um_filter_33_9 TaxID=1974826 RepID=A0A2M7QKN8_9BACT|nr:MAG: hypothetical protein COY87_00570 [Candidatus Roizmanbacteria bacterium CG_4_10_14_0_8_um_filter_33_9]